MAHVLPKVTVRTWRLVVTNEKLADVLAKILANGEWLAAANDKANSFFFFFLNYLKTKLTVSPQKITVSCETIYSILSISDC